MKISVEFYDTKVTVEHNDDGPTASEFVENMVKPLMLGMEYHYDSVAFALGETDIDPADSLRQ